MARKKITGFSLPAGGLQWIDLPDFDRATAKAVLAFLEDRRVLFGERHLEDQLHCLHSVMQIRTFLTGRLTTDVDIGDDLTGTLQAMRACCRRFIEAAGPDGSRFWPPGQHGAWEADPFSLALGDFRTSICFYVAGLAQLYKLTLAEELAAVLPVPQPDDDLSDWIPGFQTP